MNITLRKIAINTAVIFGTLAVAFMLWEFHQAIILFIFSLAVAAAARPMVETLSQRGMSVGLSIILVYMLVVILLVLVFWAVGSSLLHEIQLLTNRLSLAYDTLWATWPNGTAFQQMMVRELPAPDDLYKGFSPDQENSAYSGLLNFTMTSTTAIGEIFTVFIMSIYWSIDRVHFERLWLSLLPVESRARSRDIWRHIENDFGAYVRSELLQSLLAGVLMGFGMWLMGVPYPTLLAVFAALAWFVPWLGGVLAVIPVLLAGLTQGPLIAALATLYTIGVLFFLEFVIEPRFIRRKQFSSLLSILLIIALVEPFGLWGLIVAPPLAAAFELIFRYNLQYRPVPVAAESSERISELRARIEHVRDLMANLKGSDDEVGPQAVGIMTRMESLINRAEEEVGSQLDRTKTGRVQT